MTVNKEYIHLSNLQNQTASFATPDQSNAHGVGVIIYVDVEQITAGSMVATLQGKDGLSGHYFDILATTPILASGHATLTAYPSAVAVNNQSISLPIPYTWRVNVVMASGTAWCSIGASLID